MVALPLLVVLVLAGCSGDPDEPGADRRGAAPRVVAGVALHPVPAGVVRACADAQRDANITLLCPSLLPRPSVQLSGSSAPANFPLVAEPWPRDSVPTGIDIAYSAENGRPRFDQPERFLHLQVIEQDQRFPPGARPATLAGRRGALAPASSRGFAGSPYFANHVRFFWREHGIDYAATLHNFGPPAKQPARPAAHARPPAKQPARPAAHARPPATERVLEAIVASLRPARQLAVARRPDPERVRTIRVPAEAPVGMAADEDTVWVAGRGAPLLAIDAATGRVVRKIAGGSPVGGRVGLAVRDQGVWATLPERRGEVALHHLGPAFGVVRATVATRLGLTTVATGQKAVWVVDYGDPPSPLDRHGRRGSVLRVDLRPARVTATVPVGYAPAGIALASGSVWVANNLDGTVSRIDARQPREVETIRVGRRPTGVAAGAGGVWVANEGDDTVMRIDPGTGTAEATIPVGRGPRAVAVGARSVWVTNERDDSVSRIAPGRGRVTETIQVGGGPAGVAVAAGAVWVANQHDGTVSRIAP